MPNNKLLRTRMLRANEIQKSKYGCGIGAALRVRMGDRRRAYAQATIECNLGAAIATIDGMTDSKLTRVTINNIDNLLKEARSYIDQMATGKAKDETR